MESATAPPRKRRRTSVVVGVVLLVAAVLLGVNALLVDRHHRPAEAFAEGRVLTLDGPDLNVREWGPDGDRAVVLLHGYTASVEWWQQVAPKLAESGVRVVAVDLVGHGGSESPRDDAQYGAGGQAAAVVRAIEELGIRQAVLVGHSMGGHVATAVAEQHPQLVERVAVVDTFGAAGLLTMPVLGKLGCWPIVGAALDRFRSIDAVTESSLSTGFAEGYPVPELAHRSLERMTHRGVCESDAGIELNADRAVADRLADLDKPVLVVWGAADILTPTKSNVERYRQAGFEPVVIEGSGHTPMVEQPGELVEVLAPFVG